MPESSHTNFWSQYLPNILTGMWVFFLSSAGAVVSFIQKLRAGLIKRFSVGELAGEVFVACFVGYITSQLCLWAEVNQFLTGPLVGLSAHMGSRALFIGEQVMSRKIAKWFGVDGPLEQAQGPQGVQGDQGVRGVPGRQGVQGDRGDQGDQGTAGVSK